MARSPRFTSNRFPQKSRRSFNWVGGVATAFGVQAIAAGASTLVASMDTRVLSHVAPFTVMRVRGLLSVTSDQVGGDEIPHGAFGIAVVNGEAFDAGVGSVPTPFTESFDDRWLYHTYWAAPVAVIAGQSVSQRQEHHIIDGKAMRKMEFGDVMVCVIENGSNSQGAQFIINFRTGIKLH